MPPNAPYVLTRWSGSKLAFITCWLENRLINGRMLEQCDERRQHAHGDLVRRRERFERGGRDETFDNMPSSKQRHRDHDREPIQPRQVSATMIDP